MLILSRKPGEALVIEPNPEVGGPQDWFADGPIRLRINAVSEGQVRLGIEAARSLRILREELVTGVSSPESVPPRAALARKVRWLRGLRSWSVEELAMAAGLSPAVVMDVEGATGNARLTDLEALARAFGLSVAELFVSPGRTPEERRLMATPAGGE